LHKYNEKYLREIETLLVIIFQMFPDLQSVLRLDQQDHFQGVRVHVVEEEDQLGAFVIHHLVSLALKKQSKVVLVGFENTFGHYNGVG
jgi:16S rRNA C1402 N4-methylase RsmH